MGTRITSCIGLCRILAVMMIGSSAQAATSADLILLGPVENVSIARREIVVLGQSIALTRFTEIESTEGRSSIELLQQRTLESAISALVSARVDAKGKVFAVSIRLSSTPYVAGSTDVLIDGTISNSDQSLGIAQIGSARILVSALASTQGIDLSPGAHLVVFGRQAQPNGPIWASEASNSAIFNSNRLFPVGIHGWSSEEGDSVAGDLTTRIQSITGTGVQSITGTGVQSITGTGVQSITGTGIQSITGTGVQSITGTGVQSITGTGVQSITGTGTQSITGTGVQSITGTGVQSITGTGVQSITGTGIQSITGTGTGAQSIIGTGIQSITGTGVQSITGTGRATVN